MATPTTKSGPRPGLWGLPLAAVATASLVLPAILTVILIRTGINGGNGSALAIGVIVGAFWLMMVLHTARTVVASSPESDADK